MVAGYTISAAVDNLGEPARFEIKPQSVPKYVEFGICCLGDILPRRPSVMRWRKRRRQSRFFRRRYHQLNDRRSAGTRYLFNSYEGIERNHSHDS